MSAAPLGLSQRSRWATGQAIGFLMAQAVENPGVLSLAAGLVDPQTLPVGPAHEACLALLGDPNRAQQALQYGTTAGTERLRRHVLGHFLSEEGLTEAQSGLEPGRLVLTTGSQQLLSLVGEALLDPGDIVFAAGPTYFAYLGTLAGLGARVLTVPTDAGGMQLDALEARLAELDARGELDRVKMVYAVSYFENPSGICLAAERRAALVELVRRWSGRQRILILEDAAYRELRYDGPNLPSLWSHDPDHEFVAYALTFSKSFSPGLRVGCGILPRDLVGPVQERKGNEDFGSSNFSHHLLATVFEQDSYHEHAELVRDAYRLKRDAMLAAADACFIDLPGVDWVRPRGGLYVWMSLPESIHTGFDSELFRIAVREEGVMYVPGELCYAVDGGLQLGNQMRLSFGVLDPAGIRQGMQRLSRAVRRVIEMQGAAER